MTNRHKDTYENNGYVYYIDCSDVLTSVYVCQNSLQQFGSNQEIETTQQANRKSLIERIISDDKRITIRYKEIWYPRTEGEYSKKSKLKKGSDINGEGMVHPTRQQRCLLVWPD